LSSPDRLVVDLSSADASAIKGQHSGQGPVSGVVASQFSDERASVGRLLLALDRASEYDVRADGTRVVISVDGGPGAPAAASAATAGTPAPAKVAKASASNEAPAAKATAPAKVSAQPEVARTAAAAPTKAATAPVKTEAAPVAREEQASAPGAAALAENVVAAEADEREVSRPARRITALTLSSEALRVRTDGEVARYEVLQLENPARLAVDVYDVSLAARAPKSKGGPISEVRVGEHGGKVRLVLDVRGAMPAYRVARRADGFDVVLGVAAEQAKSETPKAVVATAAPTVPVRPETPARAEAQPAAVEVKDVVFTDASGGGRVDVKLSGKARFTVERPDPRSAVLTLENVRLPKKLERSLDTSALETP
ncbi:MAG: AMIN domain-containing protein, partial [Myxococcaceae bacterium]|nr:AMIN domain-containing protein [Myxococcaceae bacterium]